MASADTPTDTSVDYRPTIGRVSVVYRSTVGRLSVDSRPIVDRDIGRLSAIPDHVVLVLGTKSVVVCFHGDETFTMRHQNIPGRDQTQCI